MEGNRLLKNIEAAGGLADHELVVRECVTLVTKYQAESAAGPVTYTMDPDSTEAAALMELAPTPVDITEITGAVFIFEREDSEPAPTDDTNPEPETDSCQSDRSAAEEYEEAAPEQDIECAAGAAVNMTQLEERLARFGDIVMLTAPCAVDEKSPDERANATVTIKPLQATGHACVPSLRHVSGGGTGSPRRTSPPQETPPSAGKGKVIRAGIRPQTAPESSSSRNSSSSSNGSRRTAPTPTASYAPPTPTAPYAPPWRHTRHQRRHTRRPRRHTRHQRRHTRRPSRHTRNQRRPRAADYMMGFDTLLPSQACQQIEARRDVASRDC